MELVVIHRNRLFRSLLTAVLTESDGCTVTDVDPHESQSLGHILQARPDVVLMDLLLPDGRTFPLIRQIRHQCDLARVLLLVGEGGQRQIAQGIEAGAHGCLHEDSSLAELQTALQMLVRGESFCSPQLVQFLFNSFAQLSQQPAWTARPEASHLTPRELEVLELIAEGLSNKEIARQLSVSLYTVKNHVHNILDKLQVANRQEAVRSGWRQIRPESAAHRPAV